MSIILTAGKGASKRITKKPSDIPANKPPNNSNNNKKSRGSSIPNPFFSKVPVPAYSSAKLRVWHWSLKGQLTTVTLDAAVAEELITCNGKIVQCSKSFSDTNDDGTNIEFEITSQGRCYPTCIKKTTAKKKSTTAGKFVYTLYVEGVEIKEHRQTKSTKSKSLDEDILTKKCSTSNKSTNAPKNRSGSTISILFDPIG